MNANQQFVVALIAVVIGPLVTLISSLVNKKAINDVHNLVNSKMTEMIEVNRSDAKQIGATEEREAQARRERAESKDTEPPDIIG